MLYVCTSMIRQNYLMAIRYWLNHISSIMWGYIVFILIFFGSRYVSSFGGFSFGFTTDSLIVGFWVVMLTNETFQSARYFVRNEALMGTLEQLYLSPYPFLLIMTGNLIGSIVLSLTQYVPLLYILMLTTGKWLHMDIITVVPLILIAIAQAFGLGMAMGGLALINRRVAGIHRMIELLLTGSMIVSPTLNPYVRFLPLNLTWRLLRTVMVTGKHIWDLPGGSLILVVLQAAGCIGIGWLVYRKCERIAKQASLLGQY